MEQVRVKGTADRMREELTTAVSHFVSERTQKFCNAAAR